MNRKLVLATALMLILMGMLESASNTASINVKASPQFAADMPVVYVDPQDASASLGATFTASVKIFNLTNTFYGASETWEPGEPLPPPGTTYNYSLGNLYGLDIKLSWDPAILEYASHMTKIPVETYSDGVLHQQIMQWKNEVNTTTGKYWIVYNSMQQAEAFNCPDSNGTVFTMTFNVLSEGVCELRLDKVDLAVDPMLDVELELPIDIQSGVVHVGRQQKYVSVPFHYQIDYYYCGPAALEMVFDYYGEDISQTEIAEAARTHPDVTYEDELRRAAHFSNFSTSMGDEMSSNITGYSARKIGYAAFEQSGLTIDDLKSSVDRGEPLIVLTWWNMSKVYGHYRVVVGYDEIDVIVHDPWNRDLWGGTYGGANTSISYSTFLDLWEYSGNWGLLVVPWKIELEVPATIHENSDFEVTAKITYPCHTPFDTSNYPASPCKAAIKLEEGLELASGETTQHSLGNITAGASIQTSWLLHPGETGLHNISVTVTGIVNGSVSTHETYPFYNYQDTIGASQSTSLSIMPQEEPFPTQILIIILIASGIAVALLVYFTIAKKRTGKVE
jgi:uncharacterized protein YvpB